METDVIWRWNFLYGLVSWAIDPQMVAVFVKVKELSVCKALVEEEGNQKVKFEIWQTPLFILY